MKGKCNSAKTPAATAARQQQSREPESQQTTAAAVASQFSSSSQSSSIPRFGVASAVASFYTATAQHQSNVVETVNHHHSPLQSGSSSIGGRTHSEQQSSTSHILLTTTTATTKLFSGLNGADDVSPHHHNQKNNAFIAANGGTGSHHNNSDSDMRNVSMKKSFLPGAVSGCYFSATNCNRTSNNTCTTNLSSNSGAYPTTSLSFGAAQVDPNVGSLPLTSNSGNSQLIPTSTQLFTPTKVQQHHHRSSLPQVSLLPSLSSLSALNEGLLNNNNSHNVSTASTKAKVDSGNTNKAVTRPRTQSLPGGQFISSLVTVPQSVSSTDNLVVSKNSNNNNNNHQQHNRPQKPSSNKMATNQYNSSSTSTQRLIKSISLRFDSDNQHQHANSKSSKVEASRSLDTVVDKLDQQLYNGSGSKLPRSLTYSTSNKITPSTDSGTPLPEQRLNEEFEHFFDICGTSEGGDQQTNLDTGGSLSLCSTASLGVLSNLNDVLNAIPCELTDCEDNDDIDDVGGGGTAQRLTVIDESLSPLPSMDLTNTKKLDSLKTSVLNDTLPIQVIANQSPIESEKLFEGKVEEEAAVISLNSIEIESYQPLVTSTSVDDNPLSEPFDQNNCLVKDCTEKLNENASKVIDASMNNSKPMDVSNELQAKRTTENSALNKRKIEQSRKIAEANVGGKNLKSQNRSKVGTSSAKVTGTSKQSNDRTTISNKRVESSLPSSRNTSRAPTPAFSESESKYNSLCSIASTVSVNTDRTYGKSSNIASNKRVAQRVPLYSRQNTTTSASRKPVNSNNNNNTDRMSSKGEHNTEATTSVIKRSSTYTRSLNKASASSNNSSNKSSMVAKTKIQSVDQRNKLGKNALESNDAIKKSITKFTGSNLTRKNTAAISTKPAALRTLSPVSSSSQPKRPSSVASNSSAHSITPTTRAIASSRNSGIGTKALTPTSSGNFPKRTPPSTLFIAPGSSSASLLRFGQSQSSLRSSVTSPSVAAKPCQDRIKKEDQTANVSQQQQLKHYQTLCQQQNEDLSKLQNALKTIHLQAHAFLVINSHLINEYAPFDTPKLRTELAALHEKCCNLHRDCELAKESSFQKDITISQLERKIQDSTIKAENCQKESQLLQEKLSLVQQELDAFHLERVDLQTSLEQTQQQLDAEKEVRLAVEQRLEQLELSCRSDKKYRDLKEKLATYEKEVDSLNVVVDMKTQRARHLENEIMRIELELSNYESLKETYQRVQRENEALTETLGMKARKNAELSREIEQLRAELKQELNERKRMSVRYDQLEYQLNESRELLAQMSFSDSALLDDNGTSQGECGVGPAGDRNKEDMSPLPVSNFQTPFTPHHHLMGNVQSTASNRSQYGARNHIRRLFSTPLIHDSQLQSRQHFQHQDPISESKHRLPELVLSSIGANWQLPRPSSTSSSSSHSSHESNQHHHHHNPPPPAAQPQHLVDVSTSHSQHSLHHHHHYHHHHQQPQQQQQQHESSLSQRKQQQQQQQQQSPMSSPKLGNRKKEYTSMVTPSFSTPSN